MYTFIDANKLLSQQRLFDLISFTSLFLQLDNFNRFPTCKLGYLDTIEFVYFIVTKSSKHSIFSFASGALLFLRCHIEALESFSSVIRRLYSNRYRVRLDYLCVSKNDKDNKNNQ